MAGIELLRNDEAMALLRSIDDPITERLLNNAWFHLIRRLNERHVWPVADFDLLYFMELAKEIFSEHDVLKRILAGEDVGSFFADDDSSRV